MFKILALVLVAEILTAVGQIMFKKSTNSVDTYSLRGVGSQFRFLADVLAKPSIWIGFVSMALGLIVWLAALAQGELSLVFSIGSIQYIMILFLAHIFLGEKINPKKFIGTVLVVLGIVLITLS